MTTSVSKKATILKPAFAFLSLFLTILHILLVKGRDLVTFTWTEYSRLYIGVIVLLAVLFTYFFYLCLTHTLYYIGKKNKTFLSYFRFFIGYFLFMGVFWLLTWPGIFKGDEFYVIRAALSFTMSGAQSGITSLFYMVALLFFPSMASITFIQILLICTIFSVIMHDLFSVLSGKKRYFLFLPFILLPVIDGNLFTLRATLVGWIFLFVLAKVYYLTKTDRFSGKWLLVLSALTGLLCAWRSEFIYLVVFLPLAFLLLKKIHLKQAACMLVLSLIFFVLCNVPNKIALNGSNKYPISLVLNPVANLFTEVEDLKGPCVYDDVMTINELVDASLLRQSASVRNISQYWNIDDVLPKETLNRFMQASLRLIIYNPDKFLKYRWQTFAYTNGLYPGYINHPGGECIDAINKLVYYGNDYKSYFAFMNPPFGQALREKTISFLACRHYEQDNIRTNAMLPVFYNCIPGVIFLLVLFISNCIAVLRARKKQHGSVDRYVLCIVLILLTLPQLILIFLTAPAMFFMYYFGFYLSSYFLTVLSCLELTGQ